MLAMETGRVGLAVRKLEFACLGSEVVGEDILLFKASFSYVAMAAGIMGDVVTNGDSVCIVNDDAALVGLKDDIVRDDRRRIIR